VIAIDTAPTAILSALAEEQSGLIEQLHQPRKQVRAGREFWLGQLHGKPVVLALSKIGKVAAATTATALIEGFGVGRVVFTGVAGGVGTGVQVGDVVVGTGFVQHDMDASPLFAQYEIPLYGCSVFAADVGLTHLLLQACRASLQGAMQGGRVPTIHQGLIASGDQFVSGPTQAQAIVQSLLGAGHTVLALEMEGAAVAQVCADYGVPFAAVRTVSDRADDTAHGDFAQFVTEVASVYACKIVNALLFEPAASTEVPHRH
jgi:adenosylhomocysteine nucleosidase